MKVPVSLVHKGENKHPLFLPKPKRVNIGLFSRERKGRLLFGLNRILKRETEQEEEEEEEVGEVGGGTVSSLPLPLINVPYMRQNRTCDQWGENTRKKEKKENTRNIARGNNKLVRELSVSPEPSLSQPANGNGASAELHAPHAHTTMVRLERGYAVVATLIAVVSLQLLRAHMLKVCLVVLI